MPDYYDPITGQRKRATELVDLDIRAVSLVSKPANRRPFLLLKAEEEAIPMDSTLFEAEVEKRARAIIEKGDKRTPERIFADVSHEVASEQPDLYERHRRVIGNRG